MGLDYIARCKQCGSLLFWSSEASESKSLAKDISRLVIDGLSIERMATEDARTAKWDHAEDCPHKKPRKKRSKNAELPFTTTSG